MSTMQSDFKITPENIYEANANYQLILSIRNFEIEKSLRTFPDKKVGSVFH